MNTLRLTEEQRRDLLARLDEAAAAPFEDDEQRQSERVAAPEQAVVLWWREPVGSGEFPVFQTECRNISSTGIAFLHGSYVHPDTSCAIVLRMPSHEGLRIDAKTVRCRYVEEATYEVGAQFRRPVDLNALLSPAPRSENG